MDVACSVQTLNAAVDREIDSLPEDMLACLQRISGLIETFGLEQVREPYVKHIKGPLWELRLKGAAGIARAIYVVASGARVIILRIVVKKSRKLPKRELELARIRSRQAK
ncbi:MAG: type II toxin-antitoxin system RelE/ParE family toxin [Gammaproteobacteria bacterium]|nr:type II toxin-antitoxin system RelE/ParE family toxin [Gammaproteobacteria bacterium]